MCDEMLEILKLVAPGTSLRDGLENILKAKTGALIVVSNSDEILKKIPINIADLNTSCQEILSSTIVNH